MRNKKILYRKEEYNYNNDTITGEIFVVVNFRVNHTPKVQTGRKPERCRRMARLPNISLFCKIQLFKVEKFARSTHRRYRQGESLRDVGEACAC